MTLFETTANPRGGGTPYETLLGDYHIVEATTRELREACYRLRYQVYCVDNTYEDPRDNPGNLETDAYDPYSIHGLIMHRPTGMTAGTLRLIMPRALPEDLRTPFQTLCDDPFVDDPHRFPVHRTAEVSRIGVSKYFRRLALEQCQQQRLSRAELVEQAGTPSDPVSHIIVMLFRAVVDLSVRHGLDSIAAMMDRPIVRLYGRYGVHIAPIGSRVRFHGVRQPCFAKISDILATTHQDHPEIWDVLTDKGRFMPGLLDSVAAE
jgi:N-acyl amino acid synthase of PEP-CTERM/exosortase system